MPNDVHIQIACYAMTGESRRKSSSRIGAPLEVVRGVIEENAKNQQVIADEFKKKEAPTMQVTYNGFTGELVKLERSYAGKFELPVGLAGAANVKWLYNLSIYDSEKQVTHSFTGVKLEDVRFLGGAVTFGG